LDDLACARIAREVGLDQAAFLRALDETATAKLLDATVDRAIARGVFGVPSFVVEGRVYFGNDRLPIVRHVLLKRAERG
jgi:2-hydroxychromene-2-carboxylate isomerase